MRLALYLTAWVVALLALWAPASRAADADHDAHGSTTHNNPPDRDHGFRFEHNILGDSHFSSHSMFGDSDRHIHFWREGDDSKIHGSFGWRDSYGRWFWITPRSGYDRALLSYGFVPNYIANSYNSQLWRDNRYGPIVVPPAEPNLNLYYLSVQPPAGKAKEDFEVLEPTKPTVNVQPLPQQPAPDSILSPLLGGAAQVSQAFAAGEDLLARGQFDKAVESFQKAQAADKENPAPMLGLGLSYLAAGDFQQAARWIREALARHPSPEKISLDAWRMFGGPAVYDRRFLQIRAGLEANPNNADMHLLAGFLYFALADWTRAAEQFGLAEKLNPADVASAKMRALSARHAAAAGAAPAAGK